MLPIVNEEIFDKNVLQASEPVLVHFWAPWCGLCKMINPLLNKFHSQWEGQLHLVGINADDNFKLANTYRLTNLPTLILFEQGSVICRIEGFQGREDLYRTLHAALASLLAPSAGIPG